MVGLLNRADHKVIYRNYYIGSNLKQYIKTNLSIFTSSDSKTRSRNIKLSFDAIQELALKVLREE